MSHWTPLHFVANFQKGPEGVAVLKFLMDANPQLVDSLDKSLKLPIHHAKDPAVKKALFDAYPVAEVLDENLVKDIISDIRPHLERGTSAPPKDLITSWATICSHPGEDYLKHVDEVRLDKERMEPRSLS